MALIAFAIIVTVPVALLIIMALCASAKRRDDISFSDRDYKSSTRSDNKEI